MEFRGKDNEAKSVYDRVFSDAMREMYNLLITMSATSLGNPNSFHPLRFRDLMSNFRGRLCFSGTVYLNIVFFVSAAFCRHMHAGRVPKLVHW